MKRIVLSGFAAVVVLSAVLAVQAKTVNLEFKFAKGQVDKYKIICDMTMKMPGLPGAPTTPMTMKMSMIATQKVLDVLPDGSAKIKTSYSGLKVSAPGLPEGAEPENMPMKPVTLTVAKNGRIIEVEGLNAALAGMGIPGTDMSQMLNQVGYYGVVLPEKPVEVGESWSQQLPIPFGGGQIKVDSTLVAAALPVGKEVASKVKQSYGGHLDIAELMKAVAGSVPSQGPEAQQQMQAMAGMSGGMDMSGSSVFLFSPSEGKIVGMDGDVVMKAIFNFPESLQKQGAPAAMNMDANMTFKVSRVK